MAPSAIGAPVVHAPEPFVAKFTDNFSPADGSTVPVGVEAHLLQSSNHQQQQQRMERQSYQLNVEGSCVAGIDHLKGALTCFHLSSHAESPGIMIQLELSYNGVES
uniref:Uncharacterized protein n=1 Tax=Anopheles minimus TaxID=112268 RepID=A0A182WQG9_9DIPT